MEKENMKDLKIIELNENVYQIEKGKRAVVIKALNKQEAVKKACEYLGIENSLKGSKK